MGSIKKTFDAVDMMRQIREELSASIKGMTLEEELKWLASQDLKDPFLEHLRQKATQHGDRSANRRALVSSESRGQTPDSIVERLIGKPRGGV